MVARMIHCMALAVCLCLAASANQPAQAQDRPPAAVIVDEVRARSADRKLTIVGEVKPKRSSVVASETDGGVRMQLWRTLEGICSARSAESLARELENGNPTVRILAARTLGRLGVAEAAVSLSARLADEKVEGVRAELQKALGLLANPEPLIALVDSALDEDDSGRLAVLEGLSILGLAFEFGDDVQTHRRVVRDYLEFHGATYPVLLAGTSDKDAASAAFPLLDRVRAYPTTVFMDGEGNVTAVHTGFSGPATGARHDRLRERFEAEIDALVGAQ